MFGESGPRFSVCVYMMRSVFVTCAVRPVKDSHDSVIRISQCWCFDVSYVLFVSEQNKYNNGVKSQQES